MTEHKVDLRWKKATPDFSYDTYNREHTLQFKDGVIVQASAALAYKGKPAHVDPEESLVAAACSCHMLTFLAIAAKKKLIVEEYTDSAIGTLAENEEGMLAVTRITLNPKVRFSQSTAPDEQVLEKLHQSAHRHCFIANSIRSEVIISPR